MSVTAKEGTALCLHRYFDLGCEFLMLPQCKPLTNVVYIVVSVQPLLMCQTNEAFDKLSSLYLDGSTGFVTTEHRFDHISERDRDTTFHETIPSKFIDADSKMQVSGIWFGAFCHCLPSLVEHKFLSYLLTWKIRWRRS
jgi:hypothetical protein